MTRSDDAFGIIAFCFVLTLFFGSAAAWITHVVWILKKLGSDAGATFGQFVLGFLGTFVPPVGIVHGVMIWMGAA